MRERNAGSGLCCVCGTAPARPWLRAPDYLLGGDTKYEAVRCIRCGTARLDPQPDPDAMRQFYAADTYARAEDDGGASGIGRRLDAYNSQLAERVVAAVGVPEGAPPRVLDIGCGDGRFLAAMAAHGWDVEGIETDPVAANLARRRTGSAIHDTPVERLQIEHPFDLVSLFHVLEHVHDPRATLGAAARVLQPGGALVVAVPNIASLEAVLFRSAWYHLDLPRHLWGFTPHSLVRLLEESGFRATGIRYLPFLFKLQSIRNAVRAVRGVNPPHRAGAAEGEGSLRTELFLRMLDISARLGRHLPGEIMEISARRVEEAD